MPDPQFVSTAEAADIIGCSIATINRKAASGDLPPVSDTATFRMFHRSDVERIRDERKAQLEAKLAALSPSPVGDPS